MLKFHIYFDKDEETRFLNRMAQEGYALKRFFAGFYSFEPCEKGAWQYQIDIRHGFFQINPDYAAFMQDVGVEIVQTWGPWVILRRAAGEGTFQLYTDVESRIAQYKKIRLLFAVAALIEWFCLLIETALVSSKSTPFGWIAVVILSVLCIVFVHMMIRTGEIISRLKEQQGIPLSTTRRGFVSPLVPAGLFVNLINLLAMDYLPRPMRILLTVAAIILIVAGILHGSRR